DSTFISLHNDKRWQAVMDTIKKNYSPRRGSHPKGSAISQIPMSFTIDPKSSFLKSDQNGSYKNGIDKVSSLQMHAYNFSGSGWDFMQNSYNKNNLSPRFIVLDLSQPVQHSGSVPQGIIKDNDAQIHIFNIIDKTVTPWVIYDFRDLAVGTTIESPRNQINIHINGVSHLLQLGPWALSDGNEWYSYGGKLNGNGTTKVMITRNNERSYTIIAPEGSIGRLWNVSNMSKPIDMGLFKTGFIIHLQQE
ncbi:MAG TPA: hypothetical protein VMY77_11860, partial [Chitinophagaceae bacterium]|nr:hypothetical protein [Chitinophagaceae bacterium]